ncbi:DUF3006 domain-containing protein [Halalkalibacter hemicellulosilyticus]|uniref:DUF3006 domain-containing protein n=1 Tax=Halalkalibacter hemicellulosilyticusJCM 9152 TaxID=1236971 RepID=W4QE81_9BACI|nr:DUF3006 domain-containing protein [Halalkalibacter hemicellulosilyticus]GAE29669.1 hypothetical protein JCM9152_1044 [Halalkalibacter hemicellulosilyticusJCM 9152]
MTIRAVIDRIVDGDKAVLLVEEQKKEFTVRQEQLPAAAKEGTWLLLTVENEQIVQISIDTKMTNRMEDKVGATLKRLRQKRNGSRFKRKE